MTGDDLHDIRFAHFRPSSIDGMEVTVLRVGMPGTLAYELHGKAEDGPAVYNAVLKAGEPFGIRRLGFRAYLMQHTEGGFPQAFNHFPHPWLEDEDFLTYLEKIGIRSRYTNVCKGSMGPDLRLRYRSPVELGWSKMINFNHDFVGRKALEKEVAHPRRKMVTLVWNTEDIIDVYASKFRPGEPYASMDNPYERFVEGAGWTYFADQVLKDGKLVGISSGRTLQFQLPPDALALLHRRRVRRTRHGSDRAMGRAGHPPEGDSGDSVSLPVSQRESQRRRRRQYHSSSRREEVARR